MDVLVTCKYEEDPIKNEGARVDTTLYSNFSDAQGQIHVQHFPHYNPMGAICCHGNQSSNPTWSKT